MRKRSRWLWVCALVAYAFLYLPLIIVVVYSFNDSRLNAEWVGFTLDWYRKLFANDEMLLAAGNSLFIASSPAWYPRSWERWQAWRCTAIGCACCRSWS
jgi:ABC-type spermidine/putrescine transport system permease subunit II